MLQQPRRWLWQQHAKERQWLLRFDDAWSSLAVHSVRLSCVVGTKVQSGRYALESHKVLPACAKAETGLPDDIGLVNPDIVCRR